MIVTDDQRELTSKCCIFVFFFAFLQQKSQSCTTVPLQNAIQTANKEHKENIQLRNHHQEHNSVMFALLRRY